jgi:hypothetical protein
VVQGPKLTNKDLTAHVATGICEEIHGPICDVSNRTEAAEGLRFDDLGHFVGGEETVQALVMLVKLSDMRKERTSVEAIGPGAMTFEVTPRGPNSSATVFDKASIPALATAT